MLMRDLASFTLLAACLAVACTGDDGGTSTTSDDNAGSSETSASSSSESGDDVGTSGETETDTTGDTDTSSTAPDPGPECGGMTCASEEICLSFPQAPACNPKPENEPCPDGTTETQCGGAGLPCCCEPPPPTIWECAPVPEGCGGMVDCACLAEVCVPACEMTLEPDVFICEEPPAP